MTEEAKHTDNEEKTIPRPEGYTIVKYASGWVLFITLFFGMVVSFTLLEIIRNNYKDLGEWLVWIIVFGISALFWIIARKITEVKVNLKITDEGLEQTRLSGSKIYPEHRMIRWEDMKSYHPLGRMRGQSFLISVKEDMNFRISIPTIALFVRQKGNDKIVNEFRNVFWETAPDHDVHVAFFAYSNN